MPLGWGDIDWNMIFSTLSFLPDRVLMMEVGRRYRREQPACLGLARRLANFDRQIQVRGPARVFKATR